MSEEKKLKAVPQDKKDNSEFMAVTNLVAAMITSEYYMEDAYGRTGRRGNVYETVVTDAADIVKLIKETV